MKVLHVGEYVQGGVATYISMLLNHPNHTEIKDYIYALVGIPNINGVCQKGEYIIIHITEAFFRFFRQ